MESVCNGSCEVCICKQKNTIFVFTFKNTFKKIMKFVRTLFILLIGMISLTAFATTSEPEQKTEKVKVEAINFDLVVVSTIDLKQSLEFNVPFAVVSKTLINSLENYQKGDKFTGTQGEQITLIKIRKLPNGIISWKTDWVLNDKRKTVYVPEEYLKSCKRIPK